ncbi:MAG TPA: family 20 glycosylhydrolase [Armatimonadota bacterium]|jgi:hypothetical protein
MAPITPQSFRGLHYDLARQNHESLSTLRRLVRLCADCGLNELVFYMEDLWKYRKHPTLSHADAYKLEDMGALAGYAADRGVDLVPSLTTLGHSLHILTKPKYRHLAFPGKPEEFDVLNPAVFDLLGELFGEVLPHFTSPYVFVNGDEMHLSHLTEEAKEVVRKRGMAALYGEALGRVCRMIVEQGRRPIVWHDILLHHLGSLQHLPPETIIAYWFYDSQPDFPAIPWFCGQGYDVIAAPGIMKTGRWGACYGRALPNIEGQARAAAQYAEGVPAAGQTRAGRCLGTMTTVWESCNWGQALLGIHATGRWTRDAGRTTDQVLGSFSKDLLGVPAARVGKNWAAASLDDYRLRLIAQAQAGPRSPEESAILSRQTAEISKRMEKLTEPMVTCESQKNPDLAKVVQRMGANLRRARSYPRTGATEQKLLTPALVDGADRSCRVIRTETEFGHELLVLTNGLFAVAVAPDFGAAMLEWTVLGASPWSAVDSGYQRWAAAEPRVPGDPQLQCPWGAAGVGGWRETIFYNARLNPSSIWGRPFKTKILEKGGDRVSVEFRGASTAAEVRRTVTLSAGRLGLEIDCTATNRYRPGFLAIQPNVGHVLPGSCSPVLRLVEGKGATATSRWLIDGDGSLHFEPVSTVAAVESPLDGKFLRMTFRRAELSRILSDIAPEAFTLEPLGQPRWCEKGESVRLRLRYEVGPKR